jgi:hypothetical protein
MICFGVRRPVDNAVFIRRSADADLGPCRDWDLAVPGVGVELPRNW